MSGIALTKGLGRALLLAGLLALSLPAFPTVSPAQRQRATAALANAQRLRTTLESQPESRRNKADYRKVIKAFQEVYRLNPAYSKTPSAIAAIGELYEEMGRLFASDSYYLESVKTYRRLIKEYPTNRLSRDALFTVAEIYRTDLSDPQAARQAYDEFIRTFPKSDKVAEAQEKLQQLGRPPKERQEAREEALPIPAPPSEKLPPPAPSERSSAERHSGLPELTAVRRWVGPNYSRIVIGVEDEVKFNTVRLSKPDRIVLDLQNVRLSPALVGKSFPVEDGFLRQIRVAQFSASVARVVLDVERIEDYSIFSLPNPFRLVIDVQGAPQKETAKLNKPAGPAETETPAAPASRKAAKPSSSSPASAPETGKRSKLVQKTPPAVAPPVEPKPEDEEIGNAEKEEKQTAALKPPPVPEVRKEKNNVEAEGETPPAAAALTPATPTESGSRTLTRALGLKIGRIVIDPGHGGHDTGTIGPTGLQEKDVVLDVALRLRKLLEREVGCEVVMTRNDDTFIPLEERTAIANQKGADLFLSIHANASRDQTARGIETYYLNFTSSPEALEVAARENSTSQESVHQLQDLIKKIAMTEKIQESEDFARQVQRQVYARVIKTSGSQRDRGIKKAPFVVLIGANMPSVLAEISFLTNPRDERLLRRSEYREKIAAALLDGIESYVKNLGGVRTVERAASKQTPNLTLPDF